MKARVITLCAVFLLALGLLFTVAAPTAPATPSPVPAAVPDHPQIHAAIDALQNAKAHLESAKHDFGGHRAAAVQAVDAAMAQLRECMKYDR